MIGRVSVSRALDYFLDQKLTEPAPELGERPITIAQQGALEILLTIPDDLIL